MTFGRIAFSPSSYNPRIPAPQRVAELGRQQHSSHGRCLPRSPLPPLSLRCPHALRDVPTLSGMPLRPRPFVEEPRSHLLLARRPRTGLGPLPSPPPPLTGAARTLPEIFSKPRVAAPGWGSPRKSQLGSHTRPFSGAPLRPAKKGLNRNYLPSKGPSGGWDSALNAFFFCLAFLPFDFAGSNFFFFLPF